MGSDLSSEQADWLISTQVVHTGVKETCVLVLMPQKEEL